MELDDITLLVTATLENIIYIMVSF